MRKMIVAWLVACAVGGLGFSQESLVFTLRRNYSASPLKDDAAIYRLDVFSDRSGYVKLVKVWSESDGSLVLSAPVERDGEYLRWTVQWPNSGVARHVLRIRGTTLSLRSVRDAYGDRPRQAKRLTVHVESTSLRLWEDEEREATLAESRYEERPKESDDSYREPPSYYSYEDGKLIETFRGNTNHRLVFSRQGTLYRVAYQMSEDDDQWSGAGWGEIRDFGLGSSDPVVNTANYFILDQFMFLPAYLPFLWSLPITADGPLAPGL